MSQKVKTPKSVIITLAAGFGLGAITMAGISSGIVSPKAFAQNPSITVRPMAGSTSESITELHNLDTSLANLAEFVAPSVVDIRATTTRGMNAEGARMPVRQGEGSGFIIRTDGYIMTNDHVVGGADKVKVVMKDGREYDGKVIRAEDSDIAIVKIEANNLPALAFGDSSKLRPGQMCMAVGAPFGLENSVTFGHVSALGRANEVPDPSMALQGRYYPDMIQTDASINMGNSGGPLLNIDGQVIGVNTAIYSPTGVSAGIGFAIPSNQAKFIGNMLVEKGKVTRSIIGLFPQNLKEYEKKDLGIAGGARVAGFPDNTDSPAKAAGIEKGDIVTKIGTTVINSELDLRNAMLVYSPGTTVPVEVVRNGKTMKFEIKLGEYKAPKVTTPNFQELPNMSPDEFLKKFKDFDGKDNDLFKQFRKQYEEQREGDVPQLKGENRVQLGVSVATLTDELRKAKNIPAGVEGAFVNEVVPGSVAAKAGVKAGDVITSFAGKSIGTSDDLISEMEKVQAGDAKTIKFSHFGQGTAAMTEKTITFK